jgi:hypothetical protein
MARGAIYIPYRKGHKGGLGGRVPQIKCFAVPNEELGAENSFSSCFVYKERERENNNRW